MKRLLLLGDSIRLSYQPHVAELLAGQMEVVGPAENGQTSAFTSGRLHFWLKELGPPDVIHWNNGLHDIGKNKQRVPLQFPLEDYLENLRQILARLQGTGAALIWATTTPVHPTKPMPIEQWSWDNADIVRYNEAAAKLMRENKVLINDLHALVWADPDVFLAEDCLHLSIAGQKACARAVVEAVRRVLRSESQSL